MTDPTDTERLLAEARESRQFWRDGWIALDRDNVALAAKVRELQVERAGMVAKYALACTERDKAREDAYDLKAEVLAMVNGDPMNARNERAQALTAERDAALAKVSTLKGALVDVLFTFKVKAVPDGLYADACGIANVALAANQPAKGEAT